jgi:hypothetical protein
MSAPAPPVKQLSDGSRRRDDGERRGFFYFEPAKRRASLYEETTADTQLSTERFINFGWTISFPDGRGTHSLGSTRMRVKDWFAWRDPSGLWERPFYQEAARAARDQEDAVATARAEGLFERMTEEWKEFLRSTLQMPAFYEHGLWRAIAPAARPALSDTITHAIVLLAAMKQRQAQDLVVYAMDLEGEIGECSTEQARERFLTEEGWQPLRRLLERINNRTDWVERLIAVNLVCEPLIGNALRREMLLMPASANGDPVTPVIIGGAQREWLWAKEWTGALVRFLIDDEEHGAANREVLAEWLAEWNQLAEEALREGAKALTNVPRARAKEVVLAQLVAERDEVQAPIVGVKVIA